MEKPTSQEIDQKTIFKQDEAGNLLPEGNISKIDSRYEELINEIKLKILGLIESNNILSIYVTGSIAMGTTNENSDIDVLVISKANIDDNKKESIIQTIKKDVRKKGLVVKIDVSIVSEDELEKQKHIRKQFIIKLLSACVYGEDISSKLPGFKADKETAKKLCINIEKIVNQAKEVLSENEDPNTIKKRCRWIMKMILRNTFLLTLDHEKKFTTSLDTMARLSKKYFPDKSNQIDMVFNLCNNPTDNKKEILRVLDSSTPWLTEQINSLRNRD